MNQAEEHRNFPRVQFRSGVAIEDDSEIMPGIENRVSNFCRFYSKRRSGKYATESRGCSLPFFGR